MDMPETEFTATRRPVCDAGRTVGAKRALKPKQIWEIRSYPISAAACEIERFSVWPSTARSLSFPLEAFSGTGSMSVRTRGLCPDAVNRENAMSADISPRREIPCCARRSTKPPTSR